MTEPPSNVTPITKNQAQPPQQPAQQSPAQVAAEAAVVAALAALLVGNPIPVPNILALLHRQGVSPRAAESVTNLVLSMPPPTLLPIGSATKAMRRTNALRRAQYLLSAARRVSHAIGADTRPSALITALERERRFWRAHVAAAHQREQAAATLDSTAAQYGHDVTVSKAGGHVTHTVLGWHSTRDNRTTEECRQAHGKNFYADAPPAIGYPGAGPHMNCRCKAVPAWNTRRLVGGGLLPAHWRRTDIAAARRDPSLTFTRR